MHFPSKMGEVDDLVQDAWVVLVRRRALENAPNKRNPWGFIKTVAVRACIDVIRAKYAQKRDGGFIHVSLDAACQADPVLRELYS